MPRRLRIMKDRKLRALLNQHTSLTSVKDLNQLSAWLRAQLVHENPPALAKNFVEGFDQLIHAIDKSFIEAEEVLISRDIARQGLREILLQTEKDPTLSTDFAPTPEVDSEDLVFLSRKIQDLVESRTERFHDLALISNENVRILGSRNWQELGENLRQSALHLLGKSLSIEIWLPQELTGSNEPTDSFKELQGKPGQVLSVHRADDPNPVLALRVLNAEPLPADRLKIWDALAASILSSCDLIQHILSQKENGRRQSELRTAQLVQQTLMPRFEKSFPGLNITAVVESAQECGGDWWGHYALSEHRHLVLIGDVTGHGTASALVAAVLKGYADASVKNPQFDLTRFFHEFNRDLFAIGQGEICMSLLGLVIDTSTHEFEILSAGHPSPILIRDVPFNARALGDTANPVAGFSPQLPAHCVSQKLILEGPCHLLLYTDGLSETLNAENQVLGEGRIVRCLRQTAASGHPVGTDFRQALQDLQREWLCGKSVDDDTTYLILDYDPQAVGSTGQKPTPKSA